MIYGADEEFPIGGSKVVRSSDDDDVTIVGAGITLHEALEGRRRARRGGHRGARDRPVLGQAGRRGRRCATAAEATGGRIVIVEDHWPEGGLGDAVLAAFAEARSLARRRSSPSARCPARASPSELLAAAGIDAEHIAAAARALGRPAVTPSAGGRSGPATAPRGCSTLGRWPS